MLPVVTAHRRAALDLGRCAALVAMVAQVAVPAVTSQAIDEALIDEDRPARPLRVGPRRAGPRSGASWPSTTATASTARLRHRVRPPPAALPAPHPAVVLVLRPGAVGPDHLPGQLRHPLGADVPGLRPADGDVAAQLRRRASRSWPRSTSALTLVAVAALPGVYVVGARLRNLVFPLSWVIAARQADVATIVDENVNGVRVVKSFAAEERQITGLARAAERLRWANVSQADARATLRAVHGEPAPARPGRRAGLRRLAGHRRPGPDRRRWWPSTPTSSCCRRRSACSASS